MEEMKVRELMRPVDEFPRISSDATFMEAVLALEHADENYKAGKAPERILLAYNESGDIVGKLSPIDVVKALEPSYPESDQIKAGRYSHLVRTHLATAKEELRLWHKPFTELWERSNSVKINDFIKMPTQQMVNVNDKIEAAFHLFMVGRHGSLFVQDKGKIVGLILFSDVYKKIREKIRSCDFPPAA